MEFKSLLTFLCLLVVTQVAAEETYKAGVVTLPGLATPLPLESEFESVDHFQNAVWLKLADLVENNIKIYEKHIADAGKAALDILVFPEATMNYFGMPGKKFAEKFALTIPSVGEKISPCDETKHNKILARLCKAVKSAKVYTVVNVLEKVECALFPGVCSGKDKINVFNTNVVFDRTGRIIARYRKLNLFTEPMVDIPLLNEMEPFDTDFGERFFTAICFDLLFKTPTIDVIKAKGVRNIILSTLWFSQAPFLIANQAQMGFAHAHNVNLLAACGQWHSRGAAGSGIYAGRRGPLQMHLTDSPISKMLIAAVPKSRLLLSKIQNIPIIGDFIDKSLSKLTFNNPLVNLPLKQHPFSRMNVKFEPLKKYHKDCPFNETNSDHCCEYELKYKKHEIDSKKGQLGYFYYFASYFGVRKFGGNRLLGELFCAIVACIGTNPEQDCGKRHPITQSIIHKTIDFDFIKLTMTTRDKLDEILDDVFVMPSALNVNMLPLHPSQYSFETRKIPQIKSSRIIFKKSLDNIANLFTFGFYGRNFDLDNARI